MSRRANQLNAFANPLFFESIDRYEAEDSDFLLPVRGMLRGEWTFHRRTVWYGCTPPEDRARDLPSQGWKIHVSCALDNASPILEAVVPLLDANDVSFKFALDRRILSMMNSKTWGRQGAGKFITIYPVDEAEFVRLLAELHPRTAGFEGLYILSDRRYKDSKVLFYRYGGIRPLAVANERGEEVSMLTSPTGEQVPDQRLPYFHLPPWVCDPFAADHEEAEESFTDDEGRIAIKKGRYLVKNVLGFSNSGGVYIADDTESGEEVVIKEARPFVTFTEDAISLLKKEHRILSLVAATGTGIAPRPIDLFQDWEHHFLVQEFIKGQQLTTFSARNNVTLMSNPTIEDTRKFFASFKEIFIQLAGVMKVLHDHGIVFSDLSPNNVILLEDPLRVRIIDFEGAVEVGVDRPAFLFTPGFAYRDQMYGEASSFHSDYFALGAVMHYFLAPFNQIFAISPRSRFVFLKSVVDDIGFPDEVHEMIVASIGNELDQRPRPEQMIEVLERDYELRPPRFAVEERDEVYVELAEGIADYCLNLADYGRQDRLFPAYGKVFETNPLSVAYGACGVAHALQAIGREVPEAVVDWILQPTSERDSFPPGLYVGLSGIAWVVFDLGRPETAQRMMALAHEHPLAFRTHDLFHGAAGWGLANLKFFLELEDELYLDKAIEAGEHLLATARDGEKGLSWESDGEIPLGLGHGPSGVSLFLLYLYLATGRERYLDAGVRALDYDLACGVDSRDGGLSWRRCDDEAKIIYPYWQYGSAGVGAALVRYRSLLGDERYDEVLDRVFLDLDRKYAVFPGLFIGLSGIGETLLDGYRFLGEERYLRAAYRVATGLSLFRIRRDEGIAYPGDGLNKICCDLATGGAGVARFLHRLVHRGAARLLPDSLLEDRLARTGASDRLLAAGAA